jgi:ABC-type multidrug transport system permease subunit
MSPLTHTLDLIRAGLGGQSNFGIAVNILTLLLYIAAFMWLGTRFNLKIMKSE